MATCLPGSSISLPVILDSYSVRIHVLQAKAIDDKSKQALFRQDCTPVLHDDARVKWRLLSSGFGVLSLSSAPVGIDPRLDLDGLQGC